MLAGLAGEADFGLFFFCIGFMAYLIFVHTGVASPYVFELWKMQEST